MKKIITAILLCSSIFITGCNNSKKKLEAEQARLKAIEEAELQARLALEAEIKQKKEDAISKFINQFSLQELIPQLFIENINGNTNFAPVEKITEFAEADENKSIIPGGFLFFSYNLADSVEGTMAFTDSIKKYCIENNYIPPFLAIDQEGGFVNRLKSLCGPLPSEERVSTQLTESLAHDLYTLQANQMKLLGLNMNLAPVVEICNENNKDFLNQRSFGNKNQVTRYGKECIKAYEKNDISTVLKHFPGNTNTDPHSGLPEINLSESELMEMISPFEELIKEKPAGILMSHAKTSGIDGNTPSCLSSIWVTEILRNKFNYQGIIFSDDIFMAALAKNGYEPEKAVELAIDAGIDCIMISEKRIKSPCGIILTKCNENENFKNKVKTAIRHIIQYKINSGLLKMTENEDSTYSVIIPEYESDISKRIEKFQIFKDENIALYQKYF